MTGKNQTLREIEKYSEEAAAELVPRAVGELLATLVVAMQANRILEIGTGSGYATLCMSLAQPPAGKIWTFDPDIERTSAAQSFFERAGRADRIEIINQPALEVLSVFPQRNMDIVFVDAAVHDYPQYLEHCRHLLKLSGLIIFHNAQEDFLNDPDFENAFVPLGKGLAIGARKR